MSLGLRRIVGGGKGGVWMKMGSNRLLVLGGIVERRVGLVRGSIMGVFFLLASLVR